MNHDMRLESQVERLLAETPTSRAPDRLRADIASATSRTRQRPPWLTSLKEPPMRYRSQLVAGSPTLRFAAIVAVTAALTLALAGAVIAGASMLPSPVPAPPPAPMYVTGDVQPAPSCSDGDVEVDGGVRRSRNVECSPQTWTSSDPRLTGEVVRRWNQDVYPTDDGTFEVGTDAAYLRNEGGSWWCTDSYLVRGAGMSSQVLTGTTYTCVGEGGYEGLSAILVLEAAEGFSETMAGLVFAGDLPPLPEPPAGT